MSFKYFIYFILSKEYIILLKSSKLINPSLTLSLLSRILFTIFLDSLLLLKKAEIICSGLKNFLFCLSKNLNA